RAVTLRLMNFAKSTGIATVVVGHVTKEGELAGPKLLEHMVDTVLMVEGDNDYGTRFLRAQKHRFGSTQELGVFTMTSDGMIEVENPSATFLTQRETPAVGACLTATLEGNRPLLLEVQALLAPGLLGHPRRVCVGVDPARVAMLLAVLDRHGDMFVLD